LNYANAGLVLLSSFRSCISTLVLAIQKVCHNIVEDKTVTFLEPPIPAAGTELDLHKPINAQGSKGKSKDAKMIDAAKDEVALPLSETGKAASSGAGLWSRLGLLRFWWIPSIAGLIVTGAVAGMYFQPAVLSTVFVLVGLEPGGGTSKPFAIPENTLANDAAFLAPKVLEVVALGRLLPEGGIMALAFPNGAGDARVARLLVAEGDRVEVGQILAELDNLPQLLALKASAETALAAQQAALEQIRSSIQMSLSEARANRDRAVAALTQANQELKRVTTLVARKVDTQVHFEQAQSAATQATAELARTEALIQHFAGAEDNTQPDIVVAARNIDTARTNLFRAGSDVDGARVLAPRAGTVLAIHSHPGEKPAVAGVMTLGNVDQMTVELEIYQTDIGKIALGQKVVTSAASLGAPLAGNVSKIGQMVEPQSVMASDPAANADARIVKVTVTLDSESSRRARAYTNIEVIGHVAVGSQ
jgi:HlyD family secretion protein